MSIPIAQKPSNQPYFSIVLISRTGAEALVQLLRMMYILE